MPLIVGLFGRVCCLGWIPFQSYHLGDCCPVSSTSPTSPSIPQPSLIRLECFWVAFGWPMFLPPLNASVVFLVGKSQSSGLEPSPCDVLSSRASQRLRGGQARPRKERLPEKKKENASYKPSTSHHPTFPSCDFGIRISRWLLACLRGAGRNTRRLTYYFHSRLPLCESQMELPNGACSLYSQDCEGHPLDRFETPSGARFVEFKWV